MHVLIIPSWYPTEFNSISGSFFKEQAEALSKARVKVTVLSLNLFSIGTIKDIIIHPFNYKLFKLQHDTINGVDTYSVNIPTFGLTRLSVFYNIYVFLFRLYYNKIKFKIDKIDIVHAHSYKYAGYAMCKLFTNIPKIITEHTSNIITNRLTLKDKMNLSYVVEHANKFICVSNSLKKSIIKLTNTSNEILVIPNTVNSIFKYDEANDRYKENDKSFSFVSVSNLVVGKRADILIKAFNVAFKDIKNVTLKIVGDGPEKKKLEKLICDLKLSEQVTLLGQLDRKDVLSLYQTSNAFIMVSAFETFGLVYAESLMCGLPTIGTKNGGAEDILNCYGGLLCKVDDVDEIAETMKYVYNNYDIFDKKRISNISREIFLDDIVVKRIIHLYKLVLNC